MKTIKTDYVKDGFEAWYYPVENSDRCVIILAGSKGNDFANKRLAAWFGKMGCCALGLGKWQNPAEKDGVHEWPLEYFRKALDWLGARGIKKFGLYGMSMGGNMALMAASIYPDFSLTIAVEAIDFVTEGFEEGKKDGMSEWCTGNSSFTLNGKSLPFHPYHTSEREYYDLIQKSGKEHHEMSSLALYQHAEQWDIAEDCFIPVENIHGRLLIIEAADDSMWEAEKYANRMKERLERKPHTSDADVVVYPYGTHLLFPYSAARIGFIDVGNLLVRFFRSGRKNAAACRESRKQVEILLRDEIRKW